VQLPLLQQQQLCRPLQLLMIPNVFSASWLF
jgi:hypothetical protein